MKKLMLSLGTLALAALTVHAADTTWGTLKKQTDNPTAKAVGGADVSDVFDFNDASNIIRKNGSILKRNTDGVSLNLKTTDLPPGEVITLWWVVFNNPDACADGCNGPDLGNPAVEGAVFFATGAIPHPNGQVPFKADLPEGPPAGDAPFGLPGDDDGLIDAATAEIHVVLRTHGLPSDDPDVLEAQLTTFAGGCDVNVCADIQASVHLP